MEEECLEEKKGKFERGRGPNSQPNLGAATEHRAK